MNAEQETETETFGGYLCKLRLEAVIGLRNFAKLISMQPSNYSNIERGKAAPPASKETIDEICDTLGLGDDSAERSKLFDLAVKDRNRAPADVEKTIKEFPGIPVLVRTIANKQLTEKQLSGLTQYIKTQY